MLHKTHVIPGNESNDASPAGKRFTRIATNIEIEPLMLELAAVPELWLADTSRQRKVRCQRDTQNIFLRTAKKPLPPGAKNANDVHDSRTTATAKKFPRTLAFCKEIAALHRGELGRATLVSLQPQGWVRPHTDAGAYYRIRDRYHLVLRSPEGSPMTAEGETISMREGELWVFDNKALHEARNPTDELRVHLIFDVLPEAGRGFYIYAPTE
ncbi:MAG: aspartyl/asparaginyl beta-hydroxylase domain-containing protein [Gemmatimonadetes bacterium]|nr:aspartyl/asparaginyl beta-hydroxylase domain-containing protein [Gemmatimonadota bacterium]